MSCSCSYTRGRGSSIMLSEHWRSPRRLITFSYMGHFQSFATGSHPSFINVSGRFIDMRTRLQEGTVDPVRTRMSAEAVALVNTGLMRHSIGVNKIVRHIRKLLIRIALKRQYSSSEMIRARKIVNLAPVLAARACGSDPFLLQLFEDLGSLQAAAFGENSQEIST